MTKIRMKSGDVVKVIAGKEKGKTGKVIQVFPRLNRVVVEGVSLSKRHLRSRRTGEKGQIVEFSMPIHVSNVLPVTSEGKTVRHRKIVREDEPKEAGKVAKATKKSEVKTETK
ncbi:MAG: 50S ribosomal protein L24 [bacterium]|nr:50S ribosomal protein L24 [bacterium]